MIGRLAGLAALALVVAGCAAQLKPAPSAQLVAGRGQGAEASAAGVAVAARAGAWRAHPYGLESVVTPLLVTVHNRGERPLRIQLADFALVGSDARRYAALAPFEVEGSVVEPAPLSAFPRVPSYRLLGFRNGRPVYGLDPFYGRPFFADPFFYGGFYEPGYRYIDLPTGDMVQLALREGTLEPHAQLTGFVYFQRVGRDAQTVDFTARLVDARTGDEVGRVTIPFVVD